MDEGFGMLLFPIQQVMSVDIQVSRISYNSQDVVRD